MKKIFSIIVSFALLISVTTPSMAAERNNGFRVISSQVSTTGEKTTEVATISLDGEQYQVIKTEYNVGTNNSYSVVEVTSGDSIVIADSREEYILENGVKIPVFINKNMQLRGRPGTIDHGLSIKSGWQYATSTWSSVTLTGPIKQATPSALLAVIALVATGGLSMTLSIASIIVAFFSSDPYRQYDETCYLREYIYGYTNVVSQFAYVEQIYTEDYEPIPDTAVKKNGSVIPF